MRGDLRYLGFGLAVGVGLAGIGAIAYLMADTPMQAAVLEAYGDTAASEEATATTTVLPRAAATPTPRPLPTETPLPAPTATFTSAQAMLEAGNLNVVGPLDETSALNLYEAARRYIAPSEAESRAMGELINGSGYGSPSLICGPLSIAILRDAGILDAGSVPYNFWLLNPKEALGRRLLDRTFTRDRFEHYVTKDPLYTVNWQAMPLYPGDFLYIEEGTGGNFDHMLVVSRVDIAGRAYAVTNFRTEDGYTINEVLLYDPAEPRAGIFARWTEKPSALLGSTGFGGFELWRLEDTREFGDPVST